MNQTPESMFPIEISVTEVKQLLDSGDLLLIDCREQSEYDHCRIDGSVLIPMNETPEKLDSLKPHQDKQIVIHCHCLLYTSPSPRDKRQSRMPSSA